MNSHRIIPQGKVRHPPQQKINDRIPQTMDRGLCLEMILPDWRTGSSTTSNSTGLSSIGGSGGTDSLNSGMSEIFFHSVKPSINTRSVSVSTPEPSLSLIASEENSPITSLPRAMVYLFTAAAHLIFLLPQNPYRNPKTGTTQSPKPSRIFTGRIRAAISSQRLSVLYPFCRRVCGEGLLLYHCCLKS